MNVRRAIVGLGLIIGFYFGALILVDSKNHVFAALPNLISMMPVLIGLSLVSYLLRYLRWHWLLSRAGNKTNFGPGLLAYLAGFAFTATPGKVGELVRIRYFGSQGVPPRRVVAAFVYERSVDLIVLMLLSTLVIKDIAMFAFVVGSIVALLTALIFAAYSPSMLTRGSVYLGLYHFKKFAQIFLVLRDGLSACRVWATVPDVLVSIVLGILAWCLTSFCFVFLLRHLGVSLPPSSALGIYPLAMMTGAATLLPGGVGTTEITLVALLSPFDVPLGTATLAAIGIRFTSIWFAVLCGVVALATLESINFKKKSESIQELQCHSD